MGHTISGVTLAFPVPIGTPIGYKSIDPGTGEKTFGLANGCAAFKSLSAGGNIPPKGFMTRDSRGYPGLNDTEMLFGFGLETPFFNGTDGSIEPGDDIEVEGGQYILTSGSTVWPDGTTTNLSGLAGGAQALSSATAIGTELTIANGLFAVAISADYVSHYLEAVMAPIVSSSNLRIFVTKAPGYRKP